MTACHADPDAKRSAWGTVRTRTASARPGRSSGGTWRARTDAPLVGQARGPEGEGAGEYWLSMRPQHTGDLKV